jgi:hypothetical protein
VPFHRCDRDRGEFVVYQPGSTFSSIKPCLQDKKLCANRVVLAADRATPPWFRDFGGAGFIRKFFIEQEGCR